MCRDFYGEQCVVRGFDTVPPCRGRWEGLLMRRDILEGVEKRGDRMHCIHCGADVTARFSAGMWEALAAVPPKRFT